MGKPNILIDTEGMDNDRWLECRMHGPLGDIPYTVGGSDVAAIFGVSPWNSGSSKKAGLSRRKKAMRTSCRWDIYWSRLQPTGMNRYPAIP